MLSVHVDEFMGQMYIFTKTLSKISYKHMPYILMFKCNSRDTASKEFGCVRACMKIGELEQAYRKERTTQAHTSNIRNNIA